MKKTVPYSSLTKDTLRVKLSSMSRSKKNPKFLHGIIGLSEQGVQFKIRKSGVRFPLLVMCRSFGQTSHSILPLPTQHVVMYPVERKLH